MKTTLRQANSAKGLLGMSVREKVIQKIVDKHDDRRLLYQANTCFMLFTSFFIGVAVISILTHPVELLNKELSQTENALVVIMVWGEIIVFSALATYFYIRGLVLAMKHVRVGFRMAMDHADEEVEI